MQTIHRVIQAAVDYAADPAVALRKSSLPALLPLPQSKP